MALSAVETTTLASIIGASGGGLAIPPTGIVSSSGTNFSFSNAALDNATLTRLQLSGGVPQGTGAWTIQAGSWAKVRLSATTGLSTELRIDDPDGLAAGDNGAKSVTVTYDGEGLVSPLSVALTITITTIAVPSAGGRVYLHKPKWLPKNDADFIFWDVAADGDMKLPKGDASTRNRFLVVRPPKGQTVRTCRSNQKDLMWGSAMFVGFDHLRQGSENWAKPKNAPPGTPATFPAGHFLNISFAAGSAAAMGGRRPILWITNNRYRRHATNGCWAGDYCRYGTTQINDGANLADRHDVHFGLNRFDDGNLCWDAGSGDAQAPHSDLLQAANGGANDIFFFDNYLTWNGLIIYLLDGGNVLLAPNRTKAPQGARFWFQRNTLRPQVDPFGIDNGTWRYHTQSRLLVNANGQPIWNPDDGLWRAMYIEDVGFWVPVGHARRNNLPGAFATPYYPEPVLQTIAGEKWLVWLNPPTGAGRLNGDRMVMLDRKARFYETEGEMPTYIAAADTGADWRFESVAEIRAALQTPQTVLV